VRIHIFAVGPVRAVMDVLAAAAEAELELAKMASERTNQLLERVVKPGEHTLQFYARWGTEIEMGTFTSNAARFWSKNSREDLLRPGGCMEDILEDWDEEVHGERPEEGSAEWLEQDDLFGECRFVYINPQMVLPNENFFAEPLPAPASEEREEERRTIPLAELLSNMTDIAQIKIVTESEMYPDPAASSWHCTNGWKGNIGECSITVEKAVTLRELLRAQPLYAEMWVDGSSDVHVCDIEFIGDEGNCIVWDNGNGKSTEFELAPPDNMRLWRLAGTAIGRFMQLLRRSSERVYAPGGVGVEQARREFEKLAAAPHQVE
jgi:hypothetical protein